MNTAKLLKVGDKAYIKSSSTGKIDGPHNVVKKTTRTITISNGTIFSVNGYKYGGGLYSDLSIHIWESKTLKEKRKCHRFFIERDKQKKITDGGFKKFSSNI